jgi:S-formylglutathione hydrolase FrmB
LSTLDALFAARSIPDVIVVMPSGAGVGFLGRSFYLNSFDGKSRMEDFITKDLVQWIDASFRTRADRAHRAIIGISEGASGAINAAFQHPEVFGACGGHSGEYALRDDFGMHRVLGPKPGAARMLADNSPMLYARDIAPQLRHQTIYFDIGLKDGSLKDNREFDRELDSLGVAHTYNEAKGRHSWGYWRAHLAESLQTCLGPMR